MATVTGVAGLVTIGGNTVSEITGWSFDESATAISNTELVDAAETNLPGRTSWSGSIEVLWDKADATGQGGMTIGASVAVIFKSEGTATGDQIYTGTAIITGRSQTIADDSMIVQSFSLQGTGALVSGTHI